MVDEVDSADNVDRVGTVDSMSTAVEVAPVPFVIGAELDHSPGIFGQSVVLVGRPAAAASPVERPFCAIVTSLDSPLLDSVAVTRAQIGRPQPAVTDR